MSAEGNLIKPMDYTSDTYVSQMDTHYETRVTPQITNYKQASKLAKLT